MTKGDQLVERGATRLQELADRAAARGDGIGEWLSEELRNDAAFLRKLKPSLVKARAQANSSGSPEQAAAPSSPPPAEAPSPPAAAEAPPVELHASETEIVPPPPPPAAARPARRPMPKKKPSGKPGGPPPVAIVGAAFVAGILLAKFVDWRGHAHPRD